MSLNGMPAGMATKAKAPVVVETKMDTKTMQTTSHTVTAMAALVTTITQANLQNSPRRTRRDRDLAQQNGREQQVLHTLLGMTGGDEED